MNEKVRAPNSDLAYVDYCKGMKYKEIAEQLGISVNTVKTQIKYAYKKLRTDACDLEPDFLLWVLLFGFSEIFE